ncbi:hypothetical protein D3C76_700100 [compost metagenome]
MGLLLIRIALDLVHGGQLHPAHVHAAQPALAHLLDLAQVLVVGALGAVEDDLREIGLRQALGAPLVDALLRVHLRPGLRVLQVEHDQRHQRAVLAFLEGAAQQLFGLAMLGVAGAGLGRQPLAEARAGAGRGLGGFAVELFGAGLGGAVAVGRLDFRQADLRVGVAHGGQGLVVGLGGGDVAALHGLAGQAFVGQPGTACGDGDRQCQGQSFDGEVHLGVPLNARWPGPSPCSAGCGPAGRRC